MTEVPTVTLNNGIAMPLIGYGVFQIQDMEECERSVIDALQVGYRLIDTAASYGNEEAVGKAIRASGIPREEIFLTTKLWISDAGEGPTRRAFERSLERMGLDYVDLYLIHQPFNDVFGAWRDMERILDEKLARAIGVSNFKPDRLMDLALNNRIVPAVNQVETHPMHQQIEAQATMQELDVQPMAWAPFAEGKGDMFTQPVLVEIAQQHERSVAQVILRWLLQRNVVAIPKSVRIDRMRENFDILGFELTSENMAAIATLDKPESSFFDHRDPAMVRRLNEMARGT